MYVFNLQSLVLYRVSVLCDGQTVTAPRFGYPTASHLRVNPISMRHGASRTNEPDAKHTPTKPEVSVAARRGRSVRPMHWSPRIHPAHWFPPTRRIVANGCCVVLLTYGRITSIRRPARRSLCKRSRLNPNAFYRTVCDRAA